MILLLHPVPEKFLDVDKDGNVTTIIAIDREKYNDTNYFKVSIMILLSNTVSHQ